MRPGLSQLILSRAFLAAVTLLVACERPTSPPVKTGMAQLHIQAAVSAPTVVMLVVTITAADIPSPGLVFNLDVVGGTASGSLSVPAGSDRLINVAAYDAAHLKTHTGSKTVSVQAGTNPSVAITLTPLAGDQPITVTFSSYTVAVTPAAASVAVGATRALSAQVSDGSGPVSVPAGDIKWATANPAVATVSTAGVVTGVGAGVVTIMATYNGVGGSSTITVP